MTSTDTTSTQEMLNAMGAAGWRIVTHQIRDRMSSSSQWDPLVTMHYIIWEADDVPSEA